ncbi:MAG: FxsA family protein [Hyphomicrobium sp.]
MTANPLRTALVLAFFALPLLEIALLIRLGSRIGFWPVLGLVIATALIGSAIVRRAGLSIFGRAFEAADAGRPGFDGMLDGLLVASAGVLLILPGPISDTLGALLLIPPLRRFLIQRGLGRLVASPRARSRSGMQGSAQSRPDASEAEPVFPDHATPGRRSDARPGRSEPVTIDGEFRRVDDDTDGNRA